MGVALNRIGSSRVYVESVSALPGWLAYLVVADPLDSNPIDADIAWNNPAYRGWFVFLFAPVLPADWEKFAAALEASPLVPPAHTSFAWAAYTQATQDVKIELRIPVAPGTPSPVVAADCSIPFRNYGFRIAQNTPVERIEGSDSFLFTAPAFENAPPSGVAGLDLRFAADPLRYTFSGEGLIADFSDRVETGWDVALRYYSARQGGPLRYWRYPVFENPAGLQHLFRFFWDPLDPTNGARTFLAFTQIAYRLDFPEPPAPPTISPAKFNGAFASSLRTLYGESLHLFPLLQGGSEKPARLVFQSMPDREGAHTRFTLVPSGDFQLAYAAPAASAARGDLLCGLAGTEYVTATPSVPGAMGTVLRFTPGSRAFAPVFPLTGSATMLAAGATELLTDRFTTAWVSMLGGGAPDLVYHSQPPGAPLFSPESPGAVLSLLDPEVAKLSGAEIFPIAGYGSLELSLENNASRDLIDFEAQILSPVRYKAIAPASKPRPADANGTKWGTTPQGLLATLNGPNYKTVHLAKNRDYDGSISEIQFTDVQPALQTALQSSELFLVMTDSTKAGPFNGDMTITGWPFQVNLAPKAGGDFSSVLILKFGEGSLKDRARDVRSWSAPGEFNSDPNVVSAWLAGYIAEAEAQAPSAPALQSFVDLVNDENWNGVLALRLHVSLQAFPPELRGLLGGMDLSRFYGHHLGLTINQVERAGQELEMKPESSIFALINYQAANGQPTPPSDGRADDLANDIPGLHLAARRAVLRRFAGADSSAGFAYTVITLIVEFRNSTIVNFESKIILTITALLGAAAELTGPSNDLFRNSIVFEGSFENTNGQPSYSFTSSDPYRFLTASSVMKYSEFAGARFATVQDDTAAPGSAVHAQFSLNGCFNFFRVSTFDAFSFGDETSDLDLPTTGLVFTNLFIDVRFDLSDPSLVTISLDPGFLSFNLALSHARAASLFAKFPLKMSALITSSQGKLKDLGYVPVEVRELAKLGKLGTDWFGLTFILNLGSLGALAESAGFTATLLAGWSPTGETNPVELLLDLPGLGAGKKQLSLQNVLKLAIGGLQFESRVDDGGAVAGYTLRLSDIGLSFLGKKLPLSGVTDLVLFGDVSGGAASTLSWYGAYYTNAS